MKLFLADLLICPACLPAEHHLELTVHESISDDNTSGVEIIRGELVCDCCRHRFPIQDGLADMDPGRSSRAASRYETPGVLAAYLWSHFGDILADEQASDAYVRWADLMPAHSGMCLDIGTAVGRFAFEMAGKYDFVIGLDNSVASITTARTLMKRRAMSLRLPDEGRLNLTADLTFPAAWQTAKVEFIVGDAQALPFPAGCFSGLASLNMVDKLPRPLDHLSECGRVAAKNQARLLLSDPFSWSVEAAAEKNWLGGLATGPFAGHGLENIMALLINDNGPLAPAWTIEQRGHVWWKIRTHSNHYELIRSCYVRADRPAVPSAG